MNKPPMLISVHIPKTAGTTLRTLLASIYRNKVYFDYGSEFEFTEPYSPLPLNHLYRYAYNIRHYIKEGLLSPEHICIHGHFGLNKYRNRFPHAKTMLWVRDPVERCVSQYYFWKRQPDKSSRSCMHLIRNNLSVIEFCRLNSVRNLQSKFLTGIDPHEITFIGVQESFNESISIMQKKLFPYLKVNEMQVDSTNQNHSKIIEENYKLPIEIRDEILALNELDQKLYLYSKRRLTDEVNL